MFYAINAVYAKRPVGNRVISHMAFIAYRVRIRVYARNEAEGGA